jgi:DNA-directed DNA polymerase III PolC
MRSIIHLDADAFFASVEQASDSRLRDKPVAIGAEFRGTLVSASYEAQHLGIRPGMPTSRARRQVPDLVVLPGDYDKYEQFSRWMFTYVYDFTPNVEVSTLGAGYCDVTSARSAPHDIATRLRKAIKDSLKISVSEGLASNKLVSQIASRLHKPGALIHVPSGDESRFLSPLPVHHLPGLSSPLIQRLQLAGLTSIGQIAHTPTQLLAMLTGKRAPELHQFSLGEDPRPIDDHTASAPVYRRREVFNSDTIDAEHVLAVLCRLSDTLMTDVRADGKLVRTLTLCLRYNDQQEQTRVDDLHEPTDLAADLYPRLRLLLRSTWQRRVSLRQVTLTLSRLYAGYARHELDLGTPREHYDTRRRLSDAVQALRKNLGRNSIMLAHDLTVQPTSPKPRRAKNMPAQVNEARTHYGTQPTIRRSSPSAPDIATTFRALHVHSPYSFLDSAITIPELVALAAQHDMPAMAITDTGNLHAAVTFAQAANDAGIKPIFGAEMAFDGSPLLLYAETHTGYTNLCRILSGAERSQRGVGPGHSLSCKTFTHDTTGIIAIGASADAGPFFAKDNFFLGIADPSRRKHLPANRDIPIVAAPGIHYARPSDQRTFEIIQSIRTLSLAGHPHPDKRRGAFHWPTPDELAQRFRDYPDALQRTSEIAERCTVAFDFGKLQFPNFTPPDGSTPHAYLHTLVRAGARRRYGKRADGVMAQIDCELSIIEDVGYAEYFLVVWDLLQECRRRNIHWITRGSAADSLVCYCLNISDVCPIRFDLYFRRFLNRERMHLKKLPDIDIDFAHDEKDSVVDLIFEKYGHEHAAAVGGFSTYWGRSALGDVGKVLGISEQQIRKLTKRLPNIHPRDFDKLDQHVQCKDLPVNEEPLKTALHLAKRLDGFPRNPKMHPCGIVLSRVPINSLTPCFRSGKGYPTTHLDMDGVEAVGLVKLDILAQGGLAAMRDVALMLRERDIDLDLHSLEPWEDERVWDMIAAGDARAVHHIESPAMVGLSRLCNVRDIDTLIAIVSVIRPGAANQNKKQQFALRYQGIEPITYAHSSLIPCLKCTCGMLVYEEQVLQICECFAGMPPDEGDLLRRALNKENWERVAELGLRFNTCAQALDRSAEDIHKVWELVCGFHGFSFCKAHSTAYGVEAYQSAWMKLNYPAEFMAAVLSNGKGFYSALVYILECHRLGIRMRPPHVNHPGPRFHMEDGAIRIPLSATKGLRKATIARIERERQRAPFTSLADFHRRSRPNAKDAELLLVIGALDGRWPDDTGPSASRTERFWELQHLNQAAQADRNSTPSHHALLDGSRPELSAPDLARTEPTALDQLNVEHDLLGYTVTDHPLARFPGIDWSIYTPLGDLHKHPGKTVTCCGLIVVTRVVYHDSGEQMKFLTLVDHSGMVETEMFARAYHQYGLATVRYPVIEVHATVQTFPNGKGFTLNIHKATKARMLARTHT